MYGVTTIARGAVGRRERLRRAAPVGSSVARVERRSERDPRREHAQDGRGGEAQPARREPGPEAHRRGHDRDDRVPRDEVVLSRDREHDRYQDHGDRERARDERAAPLGRRETHEERDADEQEQRRERAAERLGGEAVADDEVLRDPGDPRGEGRPGHGLAVVALLQQERHVDDERRRREERREDDRPTGASANEQPHHLRADEEQGVVVRRDRQRGERPPTPRAPVATRGARARRRAPFPRRGARAGRRTAPPASTRRGSGFTATSAAATTPARRETRTAPAPYATGIVAVPASAERVRIPTSPSPNSDPQAQATT